MPYYTRRWAIERCKRFFGFTDEQEQQIRGDAGRAVLMHLWEDDPTAFYENPLLLLRQEWWHAYGDLYHCPGFWECLSPQATVLDFGCGTGEVSRPWIHRGGKTLLADVSTVCRAYLYDKFAGWQVDIRSPEALASSPQVDALICVDVLEHLPDPLTVQRRLWDMLRPGGYALLKLEPVFPHPGHLREAVEQFEAWCEWIRSNTEIIEVEHYAWVYKP